MCQIKRHTACACYILATLIDSPVLSTRHRAKSSSPPFGTEIYNWEDRDRATSIRQRRASRRGIVARDEPQPPVPATPWLPLGSVPWWAYDD